MTQPVRPQVTLQAQRTGSDSQTVTARLSAEGDLIIEGEDAGPQVEQFWGNRLTRYEWTNIIRAEHLASLSHALGGYADILALLEARFSGEQVVEVGAF